MNNYFIILAAGESKRFNSNIPKQFVKYKGLRMFEHSINKAKKSKLFKKIILVVNRKHKKYVSNLSNENLKVVFGGNERFISSMKALKFIRKYKPKNVFIHDAARPNFSEIFLHKLYRKLMNNNCVIPYLSPTNSIKLRYMNNLINLDRNKVYETQTPQCFKFNKLYKLTLLNKESISDECSLFIKNKVKVNFVRGEKQNKKITHSSDLYLNCKNFYGLGFDVHRLVPNRKLYLGGIQIKSKLGTLGHSDGDPVLHAITDSILGACKLGDIGKKFSDKSKKYKNIRSTILLEKVIKEITNKNYVINNIDINIITQTPKIFLYRLKLTKSISQLCKISKSQINIKGKTTEKLGVIGKEKAIACEVLTSVLKYD